MAPLRTPGVAGGATAWFYAKRSLARSNRKFASANIPIRFFDPQAPRKEDIPVLRNDILGPIITQHVPVVPDQSRANLLAALDKRCNYHTDDRCSPILWCASKALLDKLCPVALSPVDWTLERFHEWNAQFEPEKQKRHLKIAHEVRECTDKQFSAKQVFVKVEALLKRHDPNWAPRIIYQSSDIHNALLGPIMQECTRRMFGAMKNDRQADGVRFRGGYKTSPHEIVEAMEDSVPVGCKYIESDFSSNDMKQVADVHLMEIMWLSRLGAPAWLSALMIVANTIRISSRKHGMVGIVRNQLPTGAQSTTFRNTMWNSTIAYCFLIRVKGRAVILVLGDDMTMRLDNPFSTKLKNIRREYEHVARLAHMDAKVKVFHNLSDTTFLSRNFIPTDQGHIMLPLVGKALARFNVRATSNSGVSDTVYLAGKSLSYAYEFRYCPPLAKEFYNRYLELSAGGVVSLLDLGWFAKGAFFRYGADGVAKRVFQPERVASVSDLTSFYEPRSGLFGSEVVRLFHDVVHGSVDIDEARLGGFLDDFV